MLTNKLKDVLLYFFFTLRVHDKHAGLFHRLAAQEARTSKRSNYSQMAYLPLVFFIYGLLLGTVYLQQTVPLLVMSGFCVYSVASALFMFPILYNNLSTALEVAIATCTHTFKFLCTLVLYYSLIMMPCSVITSFSV